MPEYEHHDHYYDDNLGLWGLVIRDDDLYDFLAGLLADYMPDSGWDRVRNQLPGMPDGEPADSD